MSAQEIKVTDPLLLYCFPEPINTNVDTDKTRLEKELDDLETVFPGVDRQFCQDYLSNPNNPQTISELTRLLAEKEGNYPRSNKYQSLRNNQDCPPQHDRVTPLYRENTEFVAMMYHRSLPAIEMTKILQAHEYQLYQTLMFLWTKVKMEKPYYANVDGEMVLKLEKSRDPAPPPLSFDQTFLEDVEYCKRKREEMLTEQRKRIHRASELYEMEQNGIELPTCEICYDPYLESELFTCAENHRVCFNCISFELSTRASKPVVNLTCVADANCSHTYSRELIEEHLSAADSQMLLEKYERQNARGQEPAGLSECPFCDYRGETKKGSFLFICKGPTCSRVTCTLCGGLYHPTTDCAGMRAGNKLVSLMKAVTLAMDTARIRNCPSCRVPIDKQDGCNAVVCGSCKNGMCYHCGASTGRQDPHGHFTKNGPCPLWYTNNELEGQKRAKAAGLAAEQKWRLDNPEFAAIEFDNPANAL
ncbi:putative ubiquitin conjugating enzyme 7 interacting protein 1 [Blattamonas nauphoetae]|uniref:Ubiquitin conjugating enzyme 7 interacting protein 1 n=1 Tax=Blattamonas nauphoetae TaxID=2049346 RepID=A0ABQ9Y359_9EUKA|nr:putative ubiquitin conjugating enzyme 7 interacting protein 1 [Blattamonas nauphoetae]